MSYLKWQYLRYSILDLTNTSEIDQTNMTILCQNNVVWFQITEKLKEIKLEVMNIKKAYQCIKRYE